MNASTFTRPMAEGAPRHNTKVETKGQLLSDRGISKSKLPTQKTQIHKYYISPKYLSLPPMAYLKRDLVRCFEYSIVALHWYSIPVNYNRNSKTAKPQNRANVSKVKVHAHACIKYLHHFLQLKIEYLIFLIIRH